MPTTPLPQFLQQLPTLGLSWQTHGSIRLPSGRIVACDPLLSLGEARPLARRVPPGAWPVELAVAYGEVLLATIRLSENAVVRWEPALAEGEELPPGGGRPGYPVESGRGCFVDAAVVEALARAEAEHERAVIAAVEAAGIAPGDAEGRRSAVDRFEAEHPSPTAPLLEEDRLFVASAEGEVVSFPSGAGEGTYASYWGLDAEDRPVLLLTDFDLLEPPEGLGDDAELDASLDDEDLLADLAFEAEMARLEREEAPRAAPLGPQSVGPDASDEADEVYEPDEAVPVSPWEVLASAALTRWRREGLVELVPGADAGALVDDVADLLAVGADGNALEELLLEHAAIEEIYAAGDDLLEAAGERQV